MDFHLKQWRDQHQQQQHQESEQQQQQQSSVSSASANAAKIPKLLHQPTSSATTTLPLFVNQQQEEQEQEAAEAAAAHPRNSSNMGSYTYFSWAQLQELELQAMIYRYMIAGAAVPPELLHPIKKSLLLHSSPYFLHSPQYPPAAALLHSGYWGRAAMDPEPGRCRRTDGKKWRCSRDVVAGQKYCERHMHRGRNRSRKPVEIPTSTSTASAANTVTVAAAAGAAGPLSALATGGGSHFSMSRSSQPSSSIDLFHLNPNYASEVKAESRGGLFGGQSQAESRGDGHVLRHFFDDWPRPLQESDNAVGGTPNSSSCLSMSDISLKLSTGNGDEPSRNPGRDQQHPMSAWASGWGSNQVASMGGPLAEALRSSSTAAHSSPTSVLHHLARGSVSEASFVTN